MSNFAIASLKPASPSGVGLSRIAPAAPADAVRVLVVDDNTDITDVFCALVGALGHTARACHSASDCFRCLETFRPQIVLLDLCLPGCDGFEICRRIRRQAAHKSLAVIACSALDPCLYEDAARSCGFHSYLLKPVTLQRLWAALDQAVAATFQVTREVTTGSQSLPRLEFSPGRLASRMK